MLATAVYDVDALIRAGQGESGMARLQQENRHPDEDEHYHCRHDPHKAAEAEPSLPVPFGFGVDRGEHHDPQKRVTRSAACIA